MRYMIQAVAEVEGGDLTAEQIKAIVQDFVENGPYAETIIFSTGTVDLIEEDSELKTKMEVLKAITGIKELLGV